MSQPIQRQADQWSLPDRQASSTYEPSQAELRDLLGGPRIQSGLLNTREASRRTAEDATPSGGRGGMVPMTPGTADTVISQNPNFQPPAPPQGGPSVFGPWSTGGGYPGFDRTKGIPDDAKPAIVGDATGTLARRKVAVPRENPAGNLNMSPRKLDQQVTQQVTNKALKPPKPKPIPDDLGQDQSFKVPNQLKAHVDPPLPRRGYLAAFMRHADGESDKKKNPFSGEINTNPLGGARGTGSGQSYGPNQTPIAPVATGTGSAGTSGPKTYGPSSDYKPGGAEPGWEGGATSTSQPPAGSPSPNAPTQTSDESPTSATTVSDTKPSTGTGGGGGAPSGGGGGGATGGGWQARDIAPGSIDTSKTYTVQQGDTLSNIAQGAGLSGYEDLAKSNNIADPDKINVGQEIKFSPSPGGPSTPVSETPAAAAQVDQASLSSTPESSGTPVPSGSPGADVGGAASAISAPLPGGEAAGLPPVPGRVSRYIDPPLPPKGQLKKFLAGSRHLADTEEERKKGTQYSPENTNPGLNNPPAPASGGGQPNTPWFTPPAPSSSDAAPGPTPSEKAGEPIKPPTPTAAPSQPTSPNTPASSDATQDSPVKTNDLANASNPNSPKPSEPAGNPAQPASPSGTDKPKTPGSYGPDIGNGFSLSDAMGVIGGIGQGINTAISSIGTIGSGLMGALNGGGLSGLI